MKAFFREHKTFFSVCWLIFTVSLGMWWFYLSLANTNQLFQLSQELGGDRMTEKLNHYDRQRMMILLEGSVFMVMLILGGITMVWFVYRDQKRHLLIQDFFATVTHEMRTPLTSLQLQVEGLIEDFSGKAVESRLQKVLEENQRIERQMDKAFYLASLMRAERLYLEDVCLDDLLESMKYTWKELHFQSKRKLYVRADRRALESILKNIFENALSHGKATTISLQISKKKDNVDIQIRDNGIGFQGNTKELGRAFKRHSSTSGTGIGYYIIFSLLKKMTATIDLKSHKENGFQILLSIPCAKGNKDT